MPSPGAAESLPALVRRASGHVHLVGVGGIGMAGVAYHLRRRGFRTSGCDLALGRVTDWLQGTGVEVRQGHDAAHLTADVQWVVRSAAVPDGSPEIEEARRRGLPVFARGAVLAALLEGRVSVAVSGTHGKTTTSAMIAHILKSAGQAPGFCIGGEVTALGGVAGAGDDRILVVEADESDGTVALYAPDYAVITNVEYDHMEHFASEQAMARCFADFAANTRKRVFFCADDPRASAVCRKLPKARAYGFSEAADIRGVGLEENASACSVQVQLADEALGRIELPVPGRHNAANALAACAVALEFKLPFERIRGALRKFVPVRRRFEKIVDNGDYLVISDYAHHPTEIRELVRTARQLQRRRVIGVFQPHRYTRTRALGADFPPALEGLDELVLVPVYEASEKPLEGGRGEDLFRRFEAAGKVPTRFLDSLEEAWKYLRSVLRPGDLLLVIGAGDVEKVAGWAREHFEPRNKKGVRTRKP